MDTPAPPVPDRVPAAARRRRDWWLFLLLFVVALLGTGGAWYYFETLGPSFAASRITSDIESSLPPGTPISKVDAWLVAHDIIEVNSFPRPKSKKRAGIVARVPMQFGPCYHELWLEFLFDENEKLSSYVVTVHSPEV